MIQIKELLELNAKELTNVINLNEFCLGIFLSMSNEINPEEYFDFLC